MRWNLRLVSQSSQSVQAIKINIFEAHRSGHVKVVVGVENVYRSGRLGFENELYIVSWRVHLLECGNRCTEVGNISSLSVCVVLVQVVMTREKEVIAFFKLHIYFNCFLF